MTHDELIKALRSTESEAGIAAANMIENLTMENRALRYAVRSSERKERVPYLRALVGELRKKLEWKDIVIALTKKKQTEAETERDALLDLMKAHRACYACKRADCRNGSDADVADCMLCTEVACPCVGCRDSSCWEWRGLTEPEEGDNHGTTD